MGMITIEDMERLAGPEGEDLEGNSHRLDVLYALIERASVFSCSMCSGDLLGRWQFCPACGGAVVWADLKGGPGG
ncbi:hypothetical protein LCGC14_2600870 [marine sediment metagenome]|uniref:Uncharacterized protein n=1 Tax=marine sediment metagenome TaxID=412755 RepID=A0A0F9CJR6_9ZZZZ